MASINELAEEQTGDLGSEEIVPLTHDPEIDPAEAKQNEQSPSSHYSKATLSEGDHGMQTYGANVDGRNLADVLSEEGKRTKRIDQDQPPQCEILVRAKDEDGQLQLSDGSSTAVKTRVYEVWPGKNVFFFKGQLICGPDPKGFILTTLAIVLSNWIFCAYIGHDISKHSGLTITFSMILTAIVLVNLIIVSTRDPGIVLRNDRPPVDEIGTSDGIRSRIILVNGVEVKLKYCRICMIFRPPRSCHCAICDNCVEKFDHHCPWIGQCIGQLNYRFYLTFIFSALIFFLYIFIFCCRRINRRISDSGAGVFRALASAPESLALASFSFVAIWFLGGLTTFHAHLVMLNQTAYENYRQRYKDSVNPFDKGRLNNIKEALFAKLPPSRVDFRAHIEPRWSTDATVKAKMEGGERSTRFWNGEDEAESAEMQHAMVQQRKLSQFCRSESA